MTNLVAVEIRATDLTGTAFSGALARVETLKKALAGMNGTVTLNTAALDAALVKAQTLRSAIGDDSGAVTVNTGSIDEALAKAAALKAAVGKDVGSVLINTGDLDSQLSTVKSKLQAHGIADLLDVNLNQGQMDQQLLLIKRKIGESGVTDLLDFNANTTEVTEQVGELERQIASTTIPLNVALDTSQINLGNLPKLGGNETINIGGGVSSETLQGVSELDDELKRAAEDYALLVGEMNDMRTPDILASMPDLNEFDTQLVRLGDDLAALGQPANLTADGLADIGMRITAAGNALDEFEQQLPQAMKDLQQFGQVGGATAAVFNGGMYDDATEQMKSLGETVDDAGASMEKAGAASGIFVNALNEGMPIFTKGEALFGVWGSEISLFGGAFADLSVPLMGTVGGFHMIVEGIIETVAILGPATIAFAAFGIASIDVIKSISVQLTNAKSAAADMAAGVTPAATGLQKMADAVKPQVYTLFGEALVYASKSTGAFSTLAQSAGQVLDNLGARFVAAMTSGNGFGGFAKTAASDLSGFGSVIGNIGGIIGNLLKAVPGYAEILLSFAGGFTHIAEVITGSALGEGIISLGLAFHGAVVWIGLAATAGAALATGLFGTALPGVLNLVAKGLTSVGLGSVVASDGFAELDAASATMAELPWGWIMAAAAGLALLVLALDKSSNAAAGFNTAMENAVQNSSLTNLGVTLAQSIAASATKVVTSQQQVNTAMQTSGEFVTGSASRFGQYTAAVQGAMDQNSEYKDGLSGLISQQGLVNTRMAALAQQFGGTASAMALMNAAGITSANITDTNNAHWAQSVIEIEAQADALSKLSDGTGRYSAAMNALGNVYVSQTLPLIQKVTSAQTTLMNVVTGSETAFDTFAQGQATLSSNASTATDKLGNLSSKVSEAGAAMGGLTAADLNLNQAFYSQVGNAQNVIESLEDQETSTKGLQTATATLAAQMIPFAGNNTAARATLVAMINDALGPGTVSLQTLNHWVSQNSTTMQGFDSIVASATIKAGTLANVLSTQLNNEFHNDLLQASGASTALAQYTKDLVDNTQDTSSGSATRAQLIKDLENAGDSASQATNYVDGLSKALGKVPKNTNADVNVNGTGAGGFTITGTGMAAGQGGIRLTDMASGGMVTGGIAGKDSVLDQRHAGRGGRARGRGPRDGAGAVGGRGARVRGGRRGRREPGRWRCRTSCRTRKATRPRRSRT